MFLAKSDHVLTAMKQRHVENMHLNDLHVNDLSRDMYKPHICGNQLGCFTLLRGLRNILLSAVDAQ